MKRRIYSSGRGSSMNKIIEIGVPIDEIEARQDRLGKVAAFKEVDSVPVLLGVDPWFWLPKIGVSFSDYYADPELMLRSQILGQKWMFENLKSDTVNFMCMPDLEGVIHASALGCEVSFPGSDIPFPKPWVKDGDDLKKLRNLDIKTEGLRKKGMEYRKKMIDYSKNISLSFKGGEEFSITERIGMPEGSQGPFTDAANIRGVNQIYLDLYERPKFAHELLDIVTDKAIEWMEFCKRTRNEPWENVSMADDSACALSPQLYEEFALPYEKRIKDHFGGKLFFHMCGKTDHLLKLLAQDLKIDHFWGFGPDNDKELVGKIMGGKIQLTGNVEASSLGQLTKEQVLQQAKECLAAFSKYKGYTLFTGLPAKAPTENVNALYEAAVNWGKLKFGS